MQTEERNIVVRTFGKVERAFVGRYRDKVMADR